MHIVKVKRHLSAAAALAMAVLGAASTSHASLLLDYSFDEGTGTKAASTGSNTTPLTLSSSSWTTGAGPGDAYAFNDPNGTITAQSSGAASPSLDGLDSFTLTGWYYQTAHQSNQFTNALFTLGNGWTQSDFTFGFNGNFNANTPGNQFLLSAGSNNDVATSATSSAIAATNTWVFFAVSYDGTKTSNNVNFYVGDNASSDTITSALSTATYNGGPLNYYGNNGATPPVAVGSFYGGNEAFEGAIDDVQLFGSTTDSSGVLSAAAIEQVREEVTTPEPMAASILCIGASGLLLRRRQRKV